MLSPVKIRFVLGWVEGGKLSRGGFKQAPARELFEEYVDRMKALGRVDVEAVAPPKGSSAKASSGGKTSAPKAKLWICEREKLGAKLLSSEQLADKLSRVLESGAGELEVHIGAADGFTQEALTEMKPDLLWSFGPMTLPHELAAVVAAEQLYRAFCILKKHPYHAGH